MKDLSALGRAAAALLLEVVLVVGDEAGDGRVVDDAADLLATPEQTRSATMTQSIQLIGDSAAAPPLVHVPV
jgi:hypothetical protein